MMRSTLSPLEKGGRGIFLSALLLSLSLALPTQGAPTSTQRFIASLTDELEAKVIGDNELAALIHSAEGGHVVNPICDATAELSTERLLAYEVFKGYIDAGDLDAAAIATWARENLADNERGRKRRDESRKETTLPWKIETTAVFAAGESHACAIDVKGDPVCWGNVMYPFPQGIGPLIHIGVDRLGGGCANNKDGQAFCTGLSGGVVPQNLKSIRSISPASVVNACALGATDTVSCWGSATKISELENLGAVESVVVQGFHGCAIKKDGFVVCWVIVDGGIVLTPPVHLGPVQYVSVGHQRACAVNANGFVVCWGVDLVGNNNVPKDLGKVLSVSCGWSHTCAVKSDHTVACWGWSNDGAATTVPEGLASVDSVFASNDCTCAVKLDGTVVCWGESEHGVHRPPAGLIVKSRGSNP